MLQCHLVVVVVEFVVVERPILVNWQLQRRVDVVVSVSRPFQ